MAEIEIVPLFRPEHVQALADRAGKANWELLQSAAFQKVVEDSARKRITGEANTREKIIEPILYDVLGFDRSENDAEHAVRHAGAGGATGSVEYYFRLPRTDVLVEAKPWDKPLDKKDSSGRSPVRQGFDYAVLSNLRWFIVTKGSEWRLYKTQLKGSQSPLGACERYFLKDIIGDRRTFLRFVATFAREAFLPNGAGISRLDELRHSNEGWQQSIGDALYAKLVESRRKLFGAIQAQFPAVPQDEVNGAVVKLIFRIMFILFGEDTPLLPRDFLVREVVARFRSDRNWGVNAILYGYIRQYFAWLDGREPCQFDIYPYDGALFDYDPILDNPGLRIDDDMLGTILRELSEEAMGRSLDYSQINPRILGNIYEQFLGYVIEIKEGRIDPKASRDTRRREGSFYTPESVTKFLVEDCVAHALALNPEAKPWELRCLDPACGCGHFLVAYVNHVAALCEDADDSRSYPEWRRYMTEHCVFGVDKDSTAVMLTKLSLWINSAMRDEPFATIDTHIKCGNSLVCGTPGDFRLADYEKRAYPDRFKELRRLRKELAKLEKQSEAGRPLLERAEAIELHREIRRTLARIEATKEPVAREFTDQLCAQWPSLGQTMPFHWHVEFAEVFEERGGFDVVVGNPPWGADLADIKDYLERGAYQLARGQYDSYELFVETAQSLLREQGVFGFIIPDSILLPEHERLRRHLLDRVTLTRLVRAGEGLFPGVFRAALFLCFANHPLEGQNRVRVATLRKEHRKQLEADTLFDPIKTIREIVDQIGCDRTQADFAANPRAEFDILTRNEDRAITELLHSSALDWAALTTTGRGVELGKTGEVLQCPYCYQWDTMPAKSRSGAAKKKCSHCRRSFAPEDAAKQDIIVSQRRRTQAWRRLLVGESVNRYHITDPLWIDPARDGINYKAEEFYEGKRLLVRKTGVGIMATIDQSGAYTNQVVFTWKLREDVGAEMQPYRLEYVLGVLNSRLMLYRFFTMFGETEWRSFPYLTQKTIQQLPIRAIDFSHARERKLHDQIADRVAAVLATGQPPTDHEDYQIESLIMQLYGITRPMCRRIFDVLHQVQRLRVIREMNIAEPDMLLDALPE